MFGSCCLDNVTARKVVPKSVAESKVARNVNRYSVVVDLDFGITCFVFVVGASHESY